MRIKRLLTGVAGALCLCSALLFPIQAHAAEQDNGTMTIATTVPDTHTATLLIAGEGTVTVNGKTYTAQSQDIEIPRLEEITWTFSPADGYVMGKVFYNKADITAELKRNTYIAAPVYEDGIKVSVTFTKGSGQNSNSASNTGNSGKQSGVNTPKTGDTSNIYPWMITLLVSLSVAGRIGFLQYRKKKQYNKGD